MHIKRILSALILIPSFIFLVLKGGVEAFIVLAAIVAMLGLREFYSLWGNKLAPPYKKTGMFCAILLILIMGFKQEGAYLAITASLLLILLAGLNQAKSMEKLEPQILLSLGGTFLGLFYVVWLLGHLIWLRELNIGRAAVLYAVLVTCSTDTAAYYVGNAIGRHKLSPVISPGKSVEGAIGGLIGAVGASYLAAWWFFPIQGLHIPILGILLGIISQLGDLCESLFKRAAEVKDSGHIIPGHGGILDRLDSLIFTAPILYYYLTLIKL